eukprot:UN34750
MYIALQTIHAPIEASYPPADKNLYKECESIQFEARKIYCQKLKYADRALGEIINYLKSSKIWDNTMIVFTTDNGGMPNQVLQGRPAVFVGAGLNIPLRGTKASAFEGGIRGLAWVTGGLVPEKLKGTKSDKVFHAIDVPTGLLGYSDTPIPDKIKEDAVELINEVLHPDQ